jgi:hypothetical protein
MDPAHALFHRENNTSIIIGVSNIRKRYTGSDRVSRVRHLQNIYCLLAEKNTCLVDKLILAYEDHSLYGSVVWLGPRGINKSPSSAMEVRQAILCVLNALDV